MIGGRFWFMLFSLIVLAKAETETSSPRKDRFFLFSVVSFNNEQCVSSTDSTIQGTCVAASECSSNGGTASGSCASGFGICCVYLLNSCPSTVRLNNTYLTNPGFPSSTTQSTCTYTVDNIQADICQIRLNFATFDIVDNTANGACLDSFRITTTNGPANLPLLCGNLAGQHIYYDVKGLTSSSLVFTLSAANGNKLWKVKVVQIECTNPLLPPNGCRQYYTGESGNIKSFNFGIVMLQGLQYTACVRQEQGYCSIQYAESAQAVPDPFLVGMVANGIDACNVAYILINTSKALIGSKFCGNLLTLAAASTVPATITDSVIPFELGIVTSSNNQPANSGFNVDFNQVPCK